MNRTPLRDIAAILVMAHNVPSESMVRASLIYVDLHNPTKVNVWGSILRQIWMAGEAMPTADLATPMAAQVSKGAARMRPANSFTAKVVSDRSPL